MTAVLHAAAALLMAGAALLTFACGVGVAAMKDPLQRLHYIAPPSTLGAAMLAAAIGLEAGLRSAVKPALVLILLTALNGVVSHAMARAAFVRRHGAWPPGPPHASPLQLSPSPSQGEGRGEGGTLTGDAAERGGGGGAA